MISENDITAVKTIMVLRWFSDGSLMTNINFQESNNVWPWNKYLIYALNFYHEKKVYNSFCQQNHHKFLENCIQFFVFCLSNWKKWWINFHIKIYGWKITVFIFIKILKKKTIEVIGKRSSKKINKNYNFSLKSYDHWNGTVYTGVSK